MYDIDIKLTPKEILDKDFKFDAKGYRPKEVDELLDLVIEDYNEFIRTIKKQEKDNQEMQEEIIRLRNENRKLAIALETQEEELEKTSKFNTNNVDLLRRLSNLEKIVYGKNE